MCVFIDTDISIYICIYIYTHCVWMDGGGVGGECGRAGGKTRPRGRLLLFSIRFLIRNESDCSPVAASPWFVVFY